MWPFQRSRERNSDLAIERASAAEIDEALADLLAPALSGLGFESFKRGRRWVRARPPIRDIFEVTASKGATYAPSWGLSLDFVPHIQDAALRWHRTNKNAVRDIVFDPADFFTDHRENFEIDGLRGAAGVRRDAARVLPKAVAQALGWFSSFEEANLLERIEQHRRAERPTQRFGFDNWVQQPLARAFVLARFGKPTEAAAALDDWLANQAGLEPTIVDRLRALPLAPS